MTQITLTRGQILEICALLADASDDHYCADDTIMGNHYLKLYEQFDALNEVVARRASERQLATLVLAEFTDDDF